LWIAPAGGSPIKSIARHAVQRQDPRHRALGYTREGEIAVPTRNNSKAMNLVFERPGAPSFFRNPLMVLKLRSGGAATLLKSSLCYHVSADRSGNEQEHGNCNLSERQAIALRVEVNH
jgi:hypothetical protein